MSNGLIVPRGGKEPEKDGAEERRPPLWAAQKLIVHEQSLTRREEPAAPVLPSLPEGVLPPLLPREGGEEPGSPALRRRPYSGTDLVHRGFHRHLVYWRAVVVVEDEDGSHAFHGRVSEISLIGASMYLRENVHFPRHGTLLLSLPATTPEGSSSTVEVEGRTVLTVLAANCELFRLGFEFGTFRNESGKILEQFMAKHVSYF